MAIPENIIDQIQSRVDIVEVISNYVPLKKAGRSYKAPCPFHNEKTPSFIVSQDKQIYHCFGCGAGGNVFSFLMKYENMQFPEAVELLAGKTGVALPKDSFRGSEESAVNNQIYSVNDTACNFFQAQLAKNGPARDYLRSRGIGEETVNKFRLGYALDSWEGLTGHLKGKGINPQLIEKAGLAVNNEKGGHYDRFRNRVTFPIIDLKDRILGFGARVLDSSLPKYINSPETPVYSKGRNLYGMNLSKDVIRKERFALVVEGYLDFIIPYQAGVQNIIATLGTALTVDQVRLIKRFANTVITVYDPDEAGENASLRGLDIFLGEDVNVYIAELPKGYDPDGYIRKFGTEDFLKLVKSGRNIFDYKFEKMKSRFDISTSHGKAGVVSEMLPTISKINNAVTKSDIIRKLAERLSVDEEAVKTELKKLKVDGHPKLSHARTAVVRGEAARAEVIVLALLIDQESNISGIKESIALDELKSEIVRRITGFIFDAHSRGEKISATGLINHFGNSDEVSSVISEAVGMLDALADKDRALTDCIARIKTDDIKLRLDKLQDEIRVAHGRKDEERVRQLMGEYNDLVRNKQVAKT